MKKAKKWILLAVIAAVVVGVFVYLWQQSRPKPVKYETQVVALSTIQKSTIVTGKIEPRDEVEIKPQISGIITELYKQAGDKVRVGDAIAKIKVIPDMAQLNSAESRVRLAKYNLENSRKVFERDSVLLAQNVIANEAYEKSRLQYISDQEEYLAAEDHLSITRDGVAQKADAGFLSFYSSFCSFLCCPIFHCFTHFPQLSFLFRLFHPNIQALIQYLERLPFSVNGIPNSVTSFSIRHSG